MLLHNLPAAAVHVASTVVKGITAPDTLDVSDSASIKNVASTLAHDTMAYYKGNVTGISVDVGDLTDPFYWWVAGALWGSMIDYYHYTGDSSYNDVVTQALLHNTNLGANLNYVPAEHAFEEGNDDLFFWGSAVINAAEINFPQPQSNLPSWLELGENVFNFLISKWDTSTCKGGLRWQIYASNPNGLDYKNSISNGGMFQLAARLARATGNDTYIDWAEKIWDWSYNVGFIDHKKWHVYDGASASQGCSKINYNSFTYTSGIYLYGAAVMANYTRSEEWKTRSSNLLDGAQWFFSPFANSTNVLWEAACEAARLCSADLSTQKGYLSRFMWKSAIMVPDLAPQVDKLMLTSAKAAVQTCVGGSTGRQCGQKWYVKGFDNNPGLGQQMCAQETVQGILARQASLPLSADDIKNVHS